MLDSPRTLLAQIVEDVGRVAGAQLQPTRAGLNLPKRFAEAFGAPPSPGYGVFLDAFDGGELGDGTRILSLDEGVDTMRRLREAPGSGELKGLWPVVERAGVLYALDAEGAPPEGEWPVVEVGQRTVDRVGTSFLRFISVLMVDRLASADPIWVATERCLRDPGLAEHWLNRVEALERSEGAPSRAQEVDEVLRQGLLTASPPGPALLLIFALKAIDGDRLSLARAALEDAMALEPMNPRDDDARLDASAISLLLALERADEVGATRARQILGPTPVSTAAYWRGEALRALAADNQKRAGLALRVVEVLFPEDTDVPRLRATGPVLRVVARSLMGAREALEAGRPEDASRLARTAVQDGPDLGVAHALYAEILNTRRDRAAADEARRATELNPSLVDGWRELGDAHLEARQAVKAEEAYRELIRREPASGFGWAKLAQALLEQGRTLESLEAINTAAERGGDAFFLAAVRGDVLAEMNRHQDAAESYEEALKIDPEDHWALHQAALEHDRAGNNLRATELYELAIKHDEDGCHQTLVDYAELLRRTGRIGDAVRLYRRAVAAVPNDTDWRQALREIEKELQTAPN